MKQNQAIAAAEAENLEIKQITTGMNGYPQGLGDYVAIGFETFEQAEEFAEQIGTETIHVYWKNGWHLVQNKGNAYEPYTSDNYVNDLGDNYNFAHVSSDSIREQIENETAKLVENSYGECDETDAVLTNIEKIISDARELQEAIDRAGEDEDVIMCYGKYYETVKKTLIGYNEDVHNYAIGVLIPSSLDEE